MMQVCRVRLRKRPSRMLDTAKSAARGMIEPQVVLCGRFALRPWSVQYVRFSMATSWLTRAASIRGDNRKWCQTSSPRPSQTPKPSWQAPSLAQSWSPLANVSETCEKTRLGTQTACCTPLGYSTVLAASSQAIGIFGCFSQTTSCYVVGIVLH